VRLGPQGALVPQLAAAGRQVERGIDQQPPSCLLLYGATNFNGRLPGQTVTLTWDRIKLNCTSNLRGGACEIGPQPEEEVTPEAGGLKTHTFPSIMDRRDLGFGDPSCTIVRLSYLSQWNKQVYHVLQSCVFSLRASLSDTFQRLPLIIFQTAILLGGSISAEVSIIHHRPDKKGRKAPARPPGFCELGFNGSVTLVGGTNTFI